MSQKLFVKACIWSGLITPAFFFIAFVLGHWIPPLSAALSAGQIASHYREHTTGIRVGGVFMMISGWSIRCSDSSNWLSSPSGFRMPIQA